MAKSSTLHDAATLYRDGQYQEAITRYTAYLDLLPSDEADCTERINVLLNRSSCFVKLKEHSQATKDCIEVLKLDKNNHKAHQRAVKSYCSQKKFTDAYFLATRWLELDPQNTTAQKENSRLGTIVEALADEDDDDDDIMGMMRERSPPEGMEDSQKSGTPNTATLNIPSTQKSNPISAVRKIAVLKISDEPDSAGTDVENTENSHLNSTEPNEVNNEVKNNWKYRTPPRGLTSEEYTMCVRHLNLGTCKFGDKCTSAHSNDELAEWKERFDKKREKGERKETVSGSVYAEQLYDKLMTAECKDTVMVTSHSGVKVHVSADLKTTVSSKRHVCGWLFTVTSRESLHLVTLLEDTSREHFNIAQVTLGPKKNPKIISIPKGGVQEWTNPTLTPRGNFENVYRIKVHFRTNIFGTFRQKIVFNFGSEPVIYNEMCVNNSLWEEVDKLTQELIISEQGRWDVSQLQVVPFTVSTLNPDDTDKNILKKYIPPPAENMLPSAIMESSYTKNNYKLRMHSLLYIEEFEQSSSISKYNIMAPLQLTDKFMLAPANNSAARFAHNGELFARLKLDCDISEDTMHGRLVLQNVTSLLLAPHSSKKDKTKASQEKIYEALVEEKGKDFIMLRLSKHCVEEMKWQKENNVNVDVQFSLNRMTHCEKHLAVDKLEQLDMLFPLLKDKLTIPWNTKRQWIDKGDCHLNAKQKEGVVAIMAGSDVILPPILLVGPFGTGKTHTLAQAVKCILKETGTRILICTHSNSAADLYIKEYLHPYVKDGHSGATPLRIYYKQRWPQTVSEDVRQYCLVDSDFRFYYPTVADVLHHRVIVCTLSTSRYLYDIGLGEDCFSHILIDEAAQALECEALMPLVLAGPKTRVVLAGDHMQMSPEVCSEFAKSREFHISLLERLYDTYPDDHPCKIMLCENYRSHQAILDYTSEVFYDSKLIAGSKQPAHDQFYPITFFTAKGEDVQHQNSTAFYNDSEVYEIAERVAELKKQWPKTWGPLDTSTIGVVSPYVDQVKRIRSELRKRKLNDVSVERVFNVQGKQFRALFLSVVRTRRTCSTEDSVQEFIDYGFLSNSKLLNTALTRAQSLVAVVGDPLTLCTVGKCRKLWERYLEFCSDNNSLFGISWTTLKSQLDGVELKKTYILNPLAPEFVPNRLFHPMYTGNNMADSLPAFLPSYNPGYPRPTPKMAHHVPIPTSFAMYPNMHQVMYQHLPLYYTPWPVPPMINIARPAVNAIDSIDDVTSQISPTNNMTSTTNISGRSTPVLPGSPRIHSPQLPVDPKVVPQPVGLPSPLIFQNAAPTMVQHIMQAPQITPISQMMTPSLHHVIPSSGMTHVIPSSGMTHVIPTSGIRHVNQTPFAHAAAGSAIYVNNLTPPLQHVMQYDQRLLPHTALPYAPRPYVPVPAHLSAAVGQPFYMINKPRSLAELQTALKSNQSDDSIVSETSKISADKSSPKPTRDSNGISSPEKHHEAKRTQNIKIHVLPNVKHAPNHLVYTKSEEDSYSSLPGVKRLEDDHKEFMDEKSRITSSSEDTSSISEEQTNGHNPAATDIEKLLDFLGGSMDKPSIPNDVCHSQSRSTSEEHTEIQIHSPLYLRKSNRSSPTPGSPDSGSRLSYANALQKRQASPIDRPLSVNISRREHGLPSTDHLHVNRNYGIPSSSPTTPTIPPPTPTHDDPNMIQSLLSEASFGVNSLGEPTDEEPPDPMEILKNLKIRASHRTEAMYQYFG